MTIVTFGAASSGIVGDRNGIVRSPRSIRRLRWCYERYGYDGLFDRRRRIPSPRRAPVAEVERVLRLYRERYRGFNVRHFFRRARTEHGVTFCYSFVKKALQGAGLVSKHRPRPPPPPA